MLLEMRHVQVIGGIQQALSPMMRPMNVLEVCLRLPCNTESVAVVVSRIGDAMMNLDAESWS